MNTVADERLVWRYLQFSKYVDFLRTQSLFFARASLFDDGSEGKWIAHGWLTGDEERARELTRANDLLTDFLNHTDPDPQGLGAAAKNFLGDLPLGPPEILSDVLGHNLLGVPAQNHRKYLETMRDGWTKTNEKRQEFNLQWKDETQVSRDSTYLSCWHLSDEQNYAMWKVYGGGLDSVAIVTTVGKLRSYLMQNAANIEKIGLKAGATAVNYIPTLQNPSDATQELLMDLLSSGSNTTEAMFAIKPTAYAYENEFRMILSANTSLFEKIARPDPLILGHSIPVTSTTVPSSGFSRLDEFVNAVYLHPEIGPDDMLVKVIRDLHSRYEVSDIRIMLEPMTAYD